MGQKESKELLESEEAKILRQISEKGGPTAVEQYIQTHLDRWKTEKVKLAVTGRSATGKSTFINAMRNLKVGDNGYAPSGTGNTTKVPMPYEDPKNPNIIYYDLPGFATLKFNKENYVKDMALYDYDYFFIFFDKVIGEDDYWVVTQLKELGKKFCLVRSKIDEDINNAKYDGADENDVIPSIRQKINQDINSNNYSLLENREAIFVISSRNKRLGDMDALVNHMEANLSSLKFEVIMYSLESITNKTIEKKYKVLKKRIRWITAITAGVAAIPVPGIDLAINIEVLLHEIRHYINVFGLNESKIKSLIEFDLTQLKCKLLDPLVKDFSKLVLSQLGKLLSTYAVESVLDIILPAIGSIISAGTTAVIVYPFLIGVLNDLRDDSYLVFKHILSMKRQ